MNRHQRLGQLMQRRGLDAVVLRRPANFAWYTGGADRPKAGRGVDASLLGTVKRRDGKLQVTYADKPLYFYAHEQPGEVKCHNVDLNGGFWWVIGPDGERRA